MLACDSKRQHNHFSTLPNHHYYTLDTHSPDSSYLYQLDTLPSSQSPSDFYSSRPSSDLAGQTVDFSSGFASPLSGTRQLMNNFSFSSPAIRVQNATPTPAYAQANGFQQPANVDQAAYATLWNNANTRMMATGSPALQTPSLNRGTKRPHQRTTSNSSSVASSTFGGGHATSYPYNSSPAMSTASKLSQQYNMDGSRTYSHNLPTPTQTPTQDSFLSSQYQNLGGAQHDQTTMASLAMNRAMEHQVGAEDEVPGMSHSGRHSVSSLGQEPTTPHTVADGYDGDFKIPTHGEELSPMTSDVEVLLHEYLQFDDDSDATHVTPHFNRTISDMKHTVPKFDRTMSDIYQDELYDPHTAVSYKSNQSSYLTPFRNTNTKITEALQAAQNARSQSPNSQLSRGVSPFRADSPYMQDRRMQTAAQIRAEQKAQAVSNELSQHKSPRHDHAPMTISPKDALLEYRPDDDDQAAAAPLFQQPFDQQSFATQAQYGQNFNNLANGSRTNNWGGDRRPQQYQPSSTTMVVPQQPQFNFSAPTATALQFQGMPFDYRQAKQDNTPDFPAHLTSMDSSASEAPASSQSSLPSIIAPSPRMSTTSSKPAGDGATLADSGAFTCTYQNCSMRFPTQQKLQKHKREGHRTATILPNQQQQHTPGVGSGMSSAALLARNSQSGPHKCDRINPTTGKPCNVVFSRPYDLTRHEDTIHNIRKQKVRCALCVEEKTFSRNDALTRHMRVVHPEVDFPGKHRRRGGLE